MKLIDKLIIILACAAAGFAVADQLFGQDAEPLPAEDKVDVVVLSRDNCEPCRRLKADVAAGALSEYRIVIETHRPPREQAYPSIHWSVIQSDGTVRKHSFIGWPEMDAAAIVRRAIKASQRTGTRVASRRTRSYFTYAPPIVETYVYSPPVRTVREVIYQFGPPVQVYSPPPIIYSPPTYLRQAPRVYRRPAYRLGPSCPGGVCPPRSGVSFGIGFTVGAAYRPQWNVNGDWSPSRGKLIWHLAMTHGYAWSALRQMSTSELMALHDRDHNAKRGELWTL